MRMKNIGIAILLVANSYFFVFVLGVGQDAEVARQKKVLTRSVADGIVRIPPAIAAQASASNTQSQTKPPGITVSPEAFAKSNEVLVVKLANAGNIVVISAENLNGFAVPDKTQENFESLLKGEPSRAKQIVRTFKNSFNRKGEKMPLEQATLTAKALTLTFPAVQPWPSRRQRILAILNQLYETVEVRADTIVVPAGRDVTISSPASKWKQKSDVQRQGTKARLQ